MFVGLDPATIAIVEKLMEVAAQISGIVLSRRKGQIEKDKEDFYRRVKEYHKKVTQMLRRKEGSSKGLAEDIASDNLFSFLAGNDNTELIFNALVYVGKLPKARRRDRTEVLRAVLRVLENISRTSFTV